MSEKEKTDRNQETAGKKGGRAIDRRDLLQGMATLPVLGIFGYAVKKQVDYDNAARAEASGPVETEKLPPIKIAQLGVGAQGQVLRDDLLKIANIDVKAVCDIWTDYNLERSLSQYRRAGFKVNGYEDYREMLDKEKDLDAVVIATPDFWHARHAIDCMRAGKHVYCEKEMATNLEDARQMVLTSRETGKLLQIGHQRRSNPRYIYDYTKLVAEAKLLGRVVTANAQWNRAVQADLGFPKRYEIPKDKLTKYGFKSMEQFRNWRWYKGLGGGPIVDIGSHQIDIFSWFLNANPKSVVASGGNDYYPTDTREWYDTVMVIYEYDTPQGPARAYYQTQTTNSSMGYFEKFMGDQGTLVVSESNANAVNAIYRESATAPWDEWVQKGYISAPKVAEAPQPGAILDVRESAAPDQHQIPVVVRDPYHTPHLKNFFNAVRGREKLNCPGEIGYETAVSVLKVNESIAANQKLVFRPEDFKI